MNTSGPILVIDDDDDDREVLAEIFRQLDFPNEVIYFKNGAEGIAYMRQSMPEPFLIISDINMPKMNGLELRTMIRSDGEIPGKRAPFIFLSTHVSKGLVDDAYDMHAQGFFQKDTSFSRAKSTMRKIVEYWKECYSPSDYADAVR